MPSMIRVCVSGSSTSNDDGGGPHRLYHTDRACITIIHASRQVSRIEKKIFKAENIVHSTYPCIMIMSYTLNIYRADRE